MTRKVLLSLCLSFCLVYSVGFCSPTYQMTEAELTRLEMIFKQLETNNNQLSTELKVSKAQLETLKNQLTILMIQSTQAKESMLTAQDSLAKVNQSFEEYAKEMKSKERRWKVEKTALYAALIYFIAERSN